MKVTFIGGGSYRILPIVRGVLAEKRVLRGGEVRLYDLDLARAEAVGRMIMKTPEYKEVRCKVMWTTSLEQALDGTEAVQVGFAVGSPLVNQLSAIASRKHGFMSSDQLSPTGAFLALTAGPTILGFARKMEKLCPDAWFLIFANPVAVYSGLVNNHTKIRALGICAGFRNHMWDLTRLMGRDEERNEYDLEVAGVNHLSFILRGRFRGEDLYEVLGRYCTKEWKPPAIDPKNWLKKHIIDALRRLVWMYQRFGVVIFSTEGDGMAHLFLEDMYEPKRQQEPTMAQIRAEIRKSAAARAALDAEFQSLAQRDLEPEFWASPPRPHIFDRQDNDITVTILKGLGGAGPQRIVTSRPSGGEVEGFKARTVLEYSQLIGPHGIEPYGKLAVPDVFHGLVSALATHQTLLGDAIASQDPRLLYHALYAYPVKHDTKASRSLFRDLLKIHAEEIPKNFQKTADYFRA